MWINKHLWVEFTRTTAQAHRLQLGGTELRLDLHRSLQGQHLVIRYIEAMIFLDISCRV